MELPRGLQRRREPRVRTYRQPAALEEPDYEPPSSPAAALSANLMQPVIYPPNPFALNRTVCVNRLGGGENSAGVGRAEPGCTVRLWTL